MSKLRIAVTLTLTFWALASTGVAAMQATAEMRSPDGDTLGTVTLTPTPRGVLLLIDLTRVPPGAHGFHIHEHAACWPDFKAAGGHFNPARKSHGIKNPEGSHAGDMPNIYAAADGSVQAELLNAKVVLGDGANSVFDNDGSAIIIHAKPDTHGDKPGAGDRIACGVIRK